jgi:hypothetical protein
LQLIAIEVFLPCNLQAFRMPEVALATMLFKSHSLILVNSDEYAISALFLFHLEKSKSFDSSLLVNIGVRFLVMV